MDPVTHGLAGFLVGQGAFRERWGIPAALAVTAGALAPDVDSLAFAWDQFAVLTYHRGLTHSVFGIPGLAMVTGALLWLLTGRRHYWRLTGLAALGIAICLPETGSDFDAGRAAQNMMLAAWSMGIASCPCSMHERECAIKTLGLPEGYRVVVVLAMGHPDPAVSMSLGKKRLGLEELAHEERWGAHQPAPRD